MKQNPTQQKWYLSVVAVLVAGISFFCGYSLVSHLGNILGWSPPADPIFVDTSRPISGDAPAPVSVVDSTSLPAVPEPADREEDDTTTPGLTPARIEVDPLSSSVSLPADSLAVVAPLEHRQRVDEAAFDLLSTTPRSVVISAARSDDRKGTSESDKNSDRFTAGSPESTVADPPVVAEEIPILPAPIVPVPSVEATIGIPVEVAIATPGASVNVSSVDGQILPETKVEVEVAELTAAATATAQLIPPLQVRQQRSPGTLYDNALGGSVSGLIGGLSAPPVDSGVNYRPADPNVVPAQANVRLPGSAGTIILPPVLVESPASNAAISKKTLPAIPAIVPQGNGNSARGANALVPGVKALLPQGPGIGVGIGGLDIRVNPVIDIR